MVAWMETLMLSSQTRLESRRKVDGRIGQPSSSIGELKLAGEFEQQLVGLIAEMIWKQEVS
jgi:hypothetical protein